MKQLVKSLLACLVLLLFGGMLRAQEALLITSETLDKKAKATLSKVYLNKNKVLIETEDEQQPMSTLYDAEKEEIYLIDHKKKEYYLLDKAEMEAMNDQMKAASQQLEQQLSQLPASQRKMIEAQMRKVQGTQPPLVYQQVARNIPVKNWKSSHYEGKNDDQLRHEVYVASYQELGEEKEDFAALISFYALLQNQLQQMSKNMPALLNFSATQIPGGEEGLPVKSILYDEQGKPETTFSLTSIEETSLAEEKWQVPPKYKQKKYSGADR